MVYDTVCHDLGKAYPEVRKLKDAELWWHYYHAVRRREEKVDELNSILEYFMQIVNPEMYKEYAKVKDSPMHEVASYKEDMDETDFSNLVKVAESRYKPKPDPSRLQPVASTATVESASNAAPAAPKPFDPRDPSTWGRPKGVPPISENLTPASESDGNDNPVSFKRWE